MFSEMIYFENEKENVSTWSDYLVSLARAALIVPIQEKATAIDKTIPAERPMNFSIKVWNKKLRVFRTGTFCVHILCRY